MSKRLDKIEKRLNESRARLPRPSCSLQQCYTDIDWLLRLAKAAAAHAEHVDPHGMQCFRGILDENEL